MFSLSIELPGCETDLTFPEPGVEDGYSIPVDPCGRGSLIPAGLPLTSSRKGPRQLHALQREGGSGRGPTAAAVRWPTLPGSEG